MGDLRLVHALGLSIPSTRLLEKYGDRLRCAPVVGILREPAPVAPVVNPERDGVNGIPEEEPNPVGTSAGGDGEGTADVKDGAVQK